MCEVNKPPFLNLDSKENSENKNKLPEYTNRDENWFCKKTKDICANVSVMTKLIITPTETTEYELWLYQELLRKDPFIEFCWDVQNNWELKYISPNVIYVLGYTTQDFISWNVRFPDIIHEEDREVVLRNIFIQHENQSWIYTQIYRVYKKDGSIIYVSDKSLNKYDWHWKVKYHFWYIYDISEFKNTQIWLAEALDEVRMLLLFDKQTWLPNKEKFFEDTFNIETWKVAIIRINKFSVLNVVFWYELWNQILDEIIKRLQDLISKHFPWSVLYRLGWVELWILFQENFSYDDIIRLLEISLKKTPINVIGINKTISIDYSVWISNKSWDLYHSWMIAVLKAKKTKKPVIYTEAIETEVRQINENNIDWIRLLDLSLAWNQVVNVYQWIRDNKTWEIKKYETLVRLNINWKLVSPWEFMPIAEISWHDTLLTYSVIDNVITRMIWNNYEFSINISLNDLSYDWIIDYLKKKIDEWLLDPKRLTIEILENIPNIVDFVLDNIWKLKKLWFKIAIDDFWTWYSNMLRLLQLQPDYLKVDGLIINWVSKNKKQFSVLKVIVDFAKANGIKLIAEYVENEDDQLLIEHLWIEYSQWNLFSKPQQELIS